MALAALSRAGRALAGRARPLAGPRGTDPGRCCYGSTATCDLTDEFLPDPVDVTVERRLQIVCPSLGLRSLGGRESFHGPISTVRCFENNPLVREALREPGEGRVLVVDGGGSLRCALLGDMLAGWGAENGWAGLILNACIRDSAEIAKTDLGVFALGTHPLKSSKRDPGFRDVVVRFGGVEFVPGQHVYADRDGVVVAATPIHLESEKTAADLKAQAQAAYHK